jgi:CheY-like chemotaxis protein
MPHDKDNGTGVSDRLEGRSTEITSSAEGKEKASAPYWVEALKALPQIGWLVLAAVLCYALLGPILLIFKQNAVSKLGMGVTGVSIEFVQRQIDEAARAKSQDIPKALKSRISRTTKNMFEVSILWLDDEPFINSTARRAMTSLGIAVDLARSTEEAIELLADGNYAVVITDQNRKNEKNAAVCFAGSDRVQPLNDRGQPVANAGCYFMWQAKKLFDDKKQKMPPLIIYTSKDYPDWGVPTYAFGITTKVDEVLHLILDALERQTTSEPN